MLQLVICAGALLAGYDSDYDDFEMTDGSDMDEATVFFVFTEDGVGFIPDIYSAEYECNFDII